ncbi:MAG: TonB-dependent receptor [Muribaculaceae bacterium]|nr:TonB-dependent receptor [Muribaculaceae bacterium]
MFAKTSTIRHLRRLIIALISILALFAEAKAEVNDTTSTPLRELVVTSSRQPSEVIPAQRLSGDELNRLNSNSVADAMRYFAGVHIKDYGGVGGVKTVNVRSMGTNHTGVVYDGVELGNAQNGQIDLGQFSLDNVEAISLYNGQKSEILQPARDFGSAASIYIRTRSPHFDNNKKYHVQAAFRTGSFALINPSALVESRLSDNESASLNVEWIKSDGRYKFRYRKLLADGSTAYDTTAVRQNGDINAIRTELNVNGDIAGGEWRAKIYHYNSQRGIPGAIVSNVWRRGERQWDNNSFAQASFTKYYSRLSLLANAKYSYYKTRYVNNDASQIKIDNIYRQQEAYASMAAEYRVMAPWKVSLSADFQYNTLDTDIYGFAHPDRYAAFVAMATALTQPRFKAQASAMATFIKDNVSGRASVNRNAFSPAVFISANPLATPDFTVRAFVKQSFRMPTFNDLYYAEMGNSALAPEKVTQYNLGLLYEHLGAGFLSAWRVNVDSYINRVRDKIVAYPRGAQFRWTMLNLGLVDIKGIDFNAALTLKPHADLMLTLKGQYTFQSAIDITDSTDSYYRNQIPYIPHHSASAVFNVVWRKWTFNTSYIYVGKRYSQPENILANAMPHWSTTDMSLCKDFRIGAVSLRALVEVNNLFGKNYDVVINYPMPGRNYRLSLRVDL